MKPITSSLSFEGYKVKTLHYAARDEYETDRKDVNLHLNPIFAKKVSINEKTKSFKLTLGVNLKDESDGTLAPFIVEVEIEGEFSYHDEMKESYSDVNAVSILFPYLRSTLSMLTTLANIPPVVIPAINVAEMFRRAKENALAEAVEKDTVKQ